MSLLFWRPVLTRRVSDLRATRRVSEAPCAGATLAHASADDGQPSSQDRPIKRLWPAPYRSAATSSRFGHARDFPRWRIVFVLLGSILIAAASLKAHQLATQPTLDDGIFTARPFLIAFVQAELLFGVWLLCGSGGRSTWLLATICFLGFAAVSGYRLLIGAETCGCFGSLKVNPAYSLLLDVACLAALIHFRAPQAEGQLRCRSAVLVAVVYLALGAPAGHFMTTFTPSFIDQNGVLVGNSNSVVLQPDKWAGRPLPVLSAINISDQLRSGKWTLVLYRHDCPHCERVLPKYNQLALSVDGAGSRHRVALVEVPPLGPPEHRSAVRACVHGKLDERFKWFVRTPVELELEDGRVVASASRAGV